LAVARYSRDTYSFSDSIAKSINNDDTVGNAHTAGNADTAGNINIGVANSVSDPHRFIQRYGFAIESLCFPQEHRASRNSQADGEARDSKRGLKADQ
jgi:hypothetical protein